MLTYADAMAPCADVVTHSTLVVTAGTAADVAEDAAGAVTCLAVEGAAGGEGGAKTGEPARYFSA
jgi:hypothetical protein